MTYPTLITISKRTALSTALCLALGFSLNNNVTAATGTSVFTMYTPAPSTFNVDNTVTATYDAAGGTWGVSSTTLFFNFLWTAYSGTLYTTPGTYTIQSGQGNTSCTYPEPTGNSLTFTVGAGQVGGTINFDWNISCAIKVVNIWNVTYDKSGVATFTTADVDGDGAPGYPMFPGGPFPGYTAQFDMLIQPEFPITLSAPIIVFNTAGQIFSTDLAAGPYTFSWGDNGLAPGAAFTNSDSTSMTIDGSALTAGTEYTLSVKATRDSDSAVVRADIKFTPVALTLSDANDSDGDGIGDATEGTSDTDGDGIPNFLDNSSSTRQIPVDTSNINSRVITSNAGVLEMGTVALTNGATNLQAKILKWSAEVTTSDIGSSDSSVNSSCVGGCYDFKVKGLSNGGIAKVVIPLSTALPDFPVYRKYTNGSWNGFEIDNNNTISSAPALSSSPITCPAAGSSAYSTVGLTPGDYCIQLTLEDGGPNDADGSANGIIVDPGGVATSKEEILAANVPSGCSMSTTPIDPTQRADWWLIAGFFAALAWLRSIRRKSHTA